jgi:Glycosyltransferase 61
MTENCDITRYAGCDDLYFDERYLDMNLANYFLGLKTAKMPFVMIPNAKLLYDSEGIPLLNDDVINLARIMEMESEQDNQTNYFNVAIRDNLFHHYFHFMETFLILYAIHCEFFPHAKLSKLFLGKKEWSNPRQANVQQKILSLIYPNTEIVTNLQESTDVENLVYIDRRLSKTSINKMIEPALFLVSKWAANLRKTIYKSLDIAKDDHNHLKSSQCLKIIYVCRNPPRTLTKNAETSLMEILSKIGVVQTVDFAKLSWEDQVRTTANHDIMVGVHGNGLTNLLWLPKHGMAMELFPEDVHHYDYQMMAEVMMLEYFGIEKKQIYRQFSRHGGVYGKPSIGISTLMADEIVLGLNAFASRCRLI